ncbi:MAG: hypothetical protein ACRCVT_01035 [Leadbetterella sp.]
MRFVLFIFFCSLHTIQAQISTHTWQNTDQSGVYAIHFNPALLNTGSSKWGINLGMIHIQTGQNAIHTDLVPYSNININTKERTNKIEYINTFGPSIFYKTKKWGAFALGITGKTNQYYTDNAVKVFEKSLLITNTEPLEGYNIASSSYKLSYSNTIKIKDQNLCIGATYNLYEREVMENINLTNNTLTYNGNIGFLKSKPIPRKAFRAKGLQKSGMDVGIFWNSKILTGKKNISFGISIVDIGLQTLEFEEIPGTKNTQVITNTQPINIEKTNTYYQKLNTTQIKENGKTEKPSHSIFYAPILNLSGRIQLNHLYSLTVNSSFQIGNEKAKRTYNGVSIIPSCSKKLLQISTPLLFEKNSITNKLMAGFGLSGQVGPLFIGINGIQSFLVNSGTSPSFYAGIQIRSKSSKQIQEKYLQ